MLHVRGRREGHTGFDGKNCEEEYHLKDQSINGRIILKWIQKDLDERAYTEFM
jgi:hypothetical protein